MGKKKSAKRTAAAARNYEHREAEVVLRPDIGTQPQFKKSKPPKRYRYDSSLAPSLEWDGQNKAREEGEAALAELREHVARLRAEIASGRLTASADSTLSADLSALEANIEQLARLGRPFLNWSGKAERLSFDVPTLPLFVHERLSTKAIIETLQGHRRSKETQTTLFDLFGDPEHSITDQVLRAYEHRDRWTNRMILGDSLVVMNSLLHYEHLGGQVQMIYMDPPYGVKFGSNFQPFVRKRDVTHNDDDDFTREPEMVQAYRDTWELGLHSYLTYLRDRLLLCRDLLTPSGSIFVQISDENVHHVRELMDEVFGAENFVANITFAKTSGSTREYLGGTADFLLFYAKDRELLKFRPPFVTKNVATEAGGPYSFVEAPDGTRRRMTTEERMNPGAIPTGLRVFRLDNLQSQSIGREKGEGASCWFPVSFAGNEWLPSRRSRWKTNEIGMKRLLEARRLEATATGLYYVRYIDVFPQRL